METQVFRGLWALWPPTPGARVWMIVCGAAITFAGFAMGFEVVNSVWQLQNPPSGEGSGVSSQSAGMATGFAVCGLLACGGIVGVRRRLDQVQRAEWHTPAASRTAATFAAFGLAMAVKLLVENATDFLDTTSGAFSLESSGAGFPVAQVVSGIAAGFWEEPLFAALPTLLAALTHRRLLIPLIALSAGLRGALHLYQGWQSFLLAIGWGLVAAVAFAAVGALSGLIAAHALTNLTAAGPWWDEAWALILPSALVGVAVIWAVTNYRTFRSDIRVERGRRTRVMTLPMVDRRVRELPDGRAEYAVEFLGGKTTMAAVKSLMTAGRFVWLESAPSGGKPERGAGMSALTKER